MKTKFTINREVFLDFNSLEESYAYYEEFLKPEGFILNKEMEEVYKMFDTEFNLNVGDRVCLNGFHIVDWKCVDLDNDYIKYDLVEE
jgi:hypothetical protein